MALESIKLPQPIKLQAQAISLVPFQEVQESMEILPYQAQELKDME